MTISEPRQSEIERREPWWSIQLHGSTAEVLGNLYVVGRITLAEYEAEVDRRLRSTMLDGCSTASVGLNHPADAANWTRRDA